MWILLLIRDLILTILKFFLKIIPIGLGIACLCAMYAKLCGG